MSGSKTVVLCALAANTFIDITSKQAIFEMIVFIAECFLVNFLFTSPPPLTTKKCVLVCQADFFNKKVKKVINNWWKMVENGKKEENSATTNWETIK